jgi:serine/threonine protein kinase
MALTTTSVLLLEYLPCSLLDMYLLKVPPHKRELLDIHGKQIAETVATALVNIAEANVVHLDIKPANVLVGFFYVLQSKRT